MVQNEWSDEAQEENCRCHFRELQNEIFNYFSPLPCKLIGGGWAMD